MSCKINICRVNIIKCHVNRNLSCKNNKMSCNEFICRVKYSNKICEIKIQKCLLFSS